MLEIYLITGVIAILVLKSTKQPPLATITKYFQKKGVGLLLPKLEHKLFCKK